jgi:hypothetical protein
MAPKLNKTLKDRFIPKAWFLAIVLASANSMAAPPTWTHQNGSMTSNGAITVKSLSGGSYAGTQNPSGAVAKSNQNAVTQPPTVIVQATARPPTVAEGAGCNMATDTIGINASQTLILTCQSGVWKRTGTSLTQVGCFEATITYYGRPASMCPVGYYMAGVRISADTGAGNNDWDAGWAVCCPGG